MGGPPRPYFVKAMWRKRWGQPNFAERSCFFRRRGIPEKMAVLPGDSKLFPTKLLGYICRKALEHLLYCISPLHLGGNVSYIGSHLL